MARILIVDDDEAVLRALTQTVRRMPHEALTARNGDEALKVCAADAIDVLVTDLIMPGKEGVELIQEVRRNYPEIKIVAMSGGGQIEVKDLLNIARHLGAHRVLAKPFSGDELTKTLTELLAPPA